MAETDFEHMEDTDSKYIDGNADYYYVRVYIIDATYHLDQTYLYYIPDSMRGLIKAGMFIIVPFGIRNRKQFAVVSELLTHDQFDHTIKAKPVSSLLYEGLAVPDDLMKLCEYLRDHTFCTVGEAVRAIMPAAAFGRINEYYAIAREIEGTKDYSHLELSVYQYIKQSQSATLPRMKLDINAEVPRALASLEEKGLISRSLEYKESGGRVFVERCSLLADEARTRELIAASEKRGPKQAAILNALLENGGMNVTELRELLGESRQQIKALAAAGVIKVDKTELYRDPYDDGNPPPPDNSPLSPSQQTALESIACLYDTHEPKAALLHGITGSGKTRVIKAMCDRVIADGRDVIILIPEIALTPQTVAYFRSAYNGKIAVIHSSLSDGERFDMWRRIKSGDIHICVGTRSAVFAPFPKLGMIVIDEEQEYTYKSDMNPKYHARDAARFRCAEQNALLLLASATPSLESYYKAQNGQYSLIELTERYGEAVLPEVIVADMRMDTAEGLISPLGSVLRGELAATLNRGEQAVLFLNRRGYNSFLSCPKCGEVIQCPHCSVSLTFHTNTHGGERGGYLSCHYCGYRQSVPQSCPKCGGEHLSYMGFGTQKVEEELNAAFPDAKILRMDADTTGSKFSYEEIIGDFRAHKADILLGTQMVTKGHDFPDVTLSAVLSADSALYLDDYHAAERTFALICQLVGRSGRGDKRGRAVIQTYNPEHPVIQLSAAQDYKRFFTNELALRRALIFPPFCDIALLTLTGIDETELSRLAAAVGKRMKELLQLDYRDIPIEVFGPFDAPIYKVKEKFRERIVMKCRLNKRTRDFLRRITADWTEALPKNNTITIDINPTSL